MIVEQRIRDYLHSLEPDQGDLLEEISRKAIRDEVPIIKKETGALLKTMVAAKRPRAILEVGTAVGYSALLMAGVMPAECTITTIEKYEPRIPVAKANFKRAGEESRITLLEGDAEEILKELEGSYDFIFMDGGKRPVYPLAADDPAIIIGWRDPVFRQCAPGWRCRPVPLCGGTP